MLNRIPTTLLSHSHYRHSFTKTRSLLDLRQPAPSTTTRLIHLPRLYRLQPNTALSARAAAAALPMPQLTSAKFSSSRFPSSAEIPKQPSDPRQVPKDLSSSTDSTVPSPVFSTEKVKSAIANGPLASPSSSSSSSNNDDASKRPSPTLHPRFSKGWWWDWAVVFVVFGITGSTTVKIVKPLVTKLFGIDGTFIDGPWAYRLLYLSTTLPLYSLILVTVGTLFGRGAYFRAVALRMWGRFLPKRR